MASLAIIFCSFAQGNFPLLSQQKGSVEVFTALLACLTKHAYVRKYFCVTNNDKACTRSIGASSDLSRARKRPKVENAKIKKSRILDVWPVYRCVKRFQVIYPALSGTYSIWGSRKVCFYAAISLEFIQNFLCSYFSRIYTKPFPKPKPKSRLMRISYGRGEM